MRQAIVVGLPGPRSGTGHAITNQVRHLRRLGFGVSFAVMASHYDGGFDEAQWREFEKHAHELEADQVFISKFSDLTLPRRAWEIGKALAGGKNAMHWALAPAHFTEPVGALLKVLAEGDIQLLLVNHVYAVPFALKLRAQARRHGKLLPMIVSTHDVQSHVLLDRGAKAPWRRKIESERELLATEIRWLAEADALIHASADDHALFRDKLPGKPHFLMLPAFRELNGKADPAKTSDLLYVGGDHPGNVQSMAWYFEEVAPFLDDRPPRHMLIGRICDHEKAFFPGGAPPWVEFVGQVKSLDPYYASARWAICPTISGRGISIKTIEAFAAGLPVIGMPLAFRGMPQDALEAAGINPVTDARSFVEAVRNSRSDSLREAGARASRDMFRQHFNDETSFAIFRNALESLNITL